MVLFLVELNGMTPYATDIGNAYIEAYTSEKVCIEASEMFGEQEGHLLHISKALYGAVPRIHTGFKLVIDRLLKQSIANELHPHEMDAALRIELII